MRTTTAAIDLLIEVLQDKYDYAHLDKTTVPRKGRGFDNQWVISAGMDGEPNEHATPSFARMNDLNEHCRNLFAALVHQAIDDWSEDFLEDALNIEWLKPSA